MRKNKRKIKKLAKETWKDKWGYEYIIMEGYMLTTAGSCAFCDNARLNRHKVEGDISMRLCAPRVCNFCLLPDYICSNGEEGKNLIAIIYKSINYGARGSFNKTVGYVKLCVKALMKTGKIPIHLEKEIKDFIIDYYEAYKQTGSKKSDE